MSENKESEPERHETKAEQLDRNWGDILQEMRVMQTGTQLIAGFLLTLPFQQAFADLDGVQRAVYLGLVVLAATTTALMLVPIALHRRLFRDHAKESLVIGANRLVIVALGAIAVLISGINWLIFDVVLDRTAGLLAIGISLVVLALLLAALPAAVERKVFTDRGDTP